MKHVFHTEFGRVVMDVRKEGTVFDLPQGMTGFQFKRFKESHKKMIQEIKDLVRKPTFIES